MFRGGVVSYATEVKHTVLGVDQALLDETMESAGFTAAGDWYIFENSKEETDS